MAINDSICAANHINGLVAPRRALAEDFRELDLKVTLRTAYHVEQLVLMQSVEGHAHAGHGTFHGIRFPNTTEVDVARALRMDPEAVMRDRQELIDEVRDYAERAATGRADGVLANSCGEPLLRFGVFRHIEVDPRGILHGLYLGGLRDEPEIRAAAERKYGVNIGYGQAYLIDRKVLHNMGISGESLARETHGQDIAAFKTAGLIVDHPGPDTAYMHIRHKSGPGASDDAAIIFAGLLWGYSAAVGCFLADAVDTLEKFATINGDQDADIARMIERLCPDLEVGHEEASKLAYLAAVPEGKEREVPDSTLRGLLEVDRRNDICAAECHLLFVEGRPTPNIDLGHGEATTHELYDYIRERNS